MPIFMPVLVPAIVAGILLTASWRLWRRKRLSDTGHWGGAVAFAAGFFAAHVIVLSWPPIPPAKAMNWLPYISLLAGVVALFQRYWGTRWYTAWPVRLILVAALLAAILKNYIQYTWEGNERIYWTAGLAVLTLILWDMLERLAAKRTGASFPLALWTLCAGSGVAYAISGSASLGQLAGALAAVCGAAVVLAWWAPGISLAHGAMTVAAPLYAGLLLQAYFYSELHIVSALLLYLAPFALRIGERRNIVYMKPWKAALLRVVIVGIPLGVAIAVAVYVVSQQPADDYYY